MTHLNKKKKNESAKYIFLKYLNIQYFNISLKTLSNEKKRLIINIKNKLEDSINKIERKKLFSKT
jgi:hypothetical protein